MQTPHLQFARVATLDEHVQAWRRYSNQLGVERALPGAHFIYDLPTADDEKLNQEMRADHHHLNSVLEADADSRWEPLDILVEMKLPDFMGQTIAKAMNHIQRFAAGNPIVSSKGYVDSSSKTLITSLKYIEHPALRQYFLWEKLLWEMLFGGWRAWNSSAPRESNDLEKCYQVLGVEPGCSDAELKTAYKRLMRETHPDTHPGDKAAEARNKEINAAHDTIRAARGLK